MIIILWLCKRLFFLLRKDTEIFRDRGHVFNLFSNSTEKIHVHKRKKCCKILTIKKIWLKNIWELFLLCHFLHNFENISNLLNNETSIIFSCITFFVDSSFINIVLCLIYHSLCMYRLSLLVDHLILICRWYGSLPLNISVLLFS